MLEGVTTALRLLVYYSGVTLPMKVEFGAGILIAPIITFVLLYAVAFAYSEQSND